MAEPFFGSVSQWPSMQVPAFGYLPASVTQFSRPPSLFSPIVSQGAPTLGDARCGSPAPNPSPPDPYVFGIGMVPSAGRARLRHRIVGGGFESTRRRHTGVYGPRDCDCGDCAGVLATVAMRRGQPWGPTNDHEIEDFLYDALDLLPGASDVEVRCEGGRATFTGSVPHRRVKRDIGEIAWAMPTLNDVQNNITIAARRSPRAPNREAEATAAAGVRKPA